MKVLYDNQIFDLQKIGGISRYFCELMKNANKFQYDFPLKRTTNAYAQDFFHIPSYMKHDYEAFLPAYSFRGKKHLYTIRNKVYNIHPENESNTAGVIQELIKQDFDVFHPTYYDPYFLEYIDEKPFVLTVHDMIHELYPEYFNEITTLHNKKILIEKAQIIIAISNQTKKDIIAFYDIDPNKIHIVYHGTSFTKNHISHFEHKEQYILFTGSRTLYKNFYFLVEALVLLFDQFPDLNLICTGSPFTAEEEDFFSVLGVKEKIKHIVASDEILIELYTHARLFIFPSLYEGFGIPILEGFACNCPVALSNASCFPEIAQDAAVYFDPKNISSMQKAILSILENDTFAQTLTLKGQNRLADFGWKKCTQETFECYQIAVENRK